MHKDIAEDDTAVVPDQLKAGVQVRERHLSSWLLFNLKNVPFLEGWRDVLGLCSPPPRAPPSFARRKSCVAWWTQH
jgi:hypothetical protein